MYVGHVNMIELRLWRSLRETQRSCKCFHAQHASGEHMFMRALYIVHTWNDVTRVNLPGGVVQTVNDFDAELHSVAPEAGVKQARMLTW